MCFVRLAVLYSMKKNSNKTCKYPLAVVWILAISAIFSLQSCAKVPVIYLGDDVNRVDFAAIVAEFPEYRNTPLPQAITPLTQQSIAAETARLRSAALSGPKPAADDDSSYRVGINDILYITVWDHPELSYNEPNTASEGLRGSPVSTDGTIFYPYVGTLEVLGLSVEQIRTKLTSRLSATIENPQLEVQVLDFRSKKAFIGGEILNPGMQKISDVPLTLLDAINNAGGTSEMADLNNASLTRQNKVYKLNLNELFESGNRDLNITLVDGDALTIPNIRESKYYVLGHVTTPVHKEMSNDSKNLFDAIQEAGGVKPVNGNTLHPPIHYFIIRSTGNGTLVFHLDQKAADSLIVMNNFQIFADDIVYVSSERRSKWNLVYKQILEYASSLNKKNAS